MEDLTPAMRQYMEIKNNNKDCIVFFRMGDFYETFYEDAKITSRALDIALTRRGIKNSEKSIPLAGIPYHALDTYLSRMIKQGYKVAIVEQLEDPKFAKGIVKRDVVRIITPGTLIEHNLLGKSNNFIAAMIPGKEKTGLAFVDMSTGEFFTTEVKIMEDSAIDLTKYSPSEVIVPMSYEKDTNIQSFIKSNDLYATYVSDVDFYIENARETLQKHFDVLNLEGFGLKDKDVAISSSGALISYLHDTQKNSLDYINSLKLYSSKEFLLMDTVTIKNLELVKNPRDGTENGSLISVLDKTQTAMGGRLLRKTLLNPLLDIAKINERLLAVEELVSKPYILNELRDLLKTISDLERLISRISYGNSNPRDLLFLQGSLSLIPEIKKLLLETDASLLTKLSKIDELKNVAKLIDDSIIDDPPVSINEGGFVKEGFNEELDRLRNISFNAKKIIHEIEEREKNATGIKSMKIRYNQIFGYYIDVTRSNLELVPEHYIRKQTLVNSERFITEELKKIEEEILNAEDKMRELEKEIFNELIAEIKKDTGKIQEAADNLAYVDVICSFSLISLKNNYKKPIIEDSFRLRMKKSRHPVVESISEFIPNDINLNEEHRMMIITGPNMAGKSVYMRQIALNAIMAQIGCFVPCESAFIGLIDKIFCRTGASDDISSGQSTFMVEMSETAQILNNATERSLVILDEIGRGTSTYDGVAIAWAVASYLAERVKAKTLFATHYHVLNNLEKEFSCVNNFNIAVEEKDDKIIFLRKIIDGGTDKSYGIHVARLAGMPKEVIEKSREIQFKLEQEDKVSEKIIIETRKTEEKDKLREEIEEVDRLIKTKQKTLDEL